MSARPNQQDEDEVAIAALKAVIARLDDLDREWSQLSELEKATAPPSLIAFFGGGETP